MGNALVVGIEEWVVVLVFGVTVKGEPGVGEPVGVFDEGASIIAPNRGIASSLLARGSLDYVKGNKQSTPPPVPCRGVRARRAWRRDGNKKLEGEKTMQN